MTFTSANADTRCLLQLADGLTGEAVNLQRPLDALRVVDVDACRRQRVNLGKLLM